VAGVVVSGRLLAGPFLLDVLEDGDQSLAVIFRESPEDIVLDGEPDISVRHMIECRLYAHGYSSQTPPPKAVA
jgi:hypothetical protein